MIDNQEFLNAVVHLCYRKTAIEEKLDRLPVKRKKSATKKEEHELENVTLMLMMVESMMIHGSRLQ